MATLHADHPETAAAQADIDQHDIRPQRLGTLDRLGGVVGNPGHNHSVPLQQCPRHFEERLVVIDYHASQCMTLVSQGGGAVSYCS